jgi:PBZ domain
MPPKRRKKAEGAAAAAAAAAAPGVGEPPLKKARSEQQQAPPPRYDDDSSASDGDDAPMANPPAQLQPAAPVDTRQDCHYGVSCYRKNPDHFRQFRHPRGHMDADRYDAIHFAPPGAQAQAQAPQASLQQPPRQQQQQQQAAVPGPRDALSVAAEIYGKMLKSALVKNRVTVDEKKLLRTFRRDNGVTDAEHAALLKRFFWSADEWEDGEKADDDVQLREEREKLEANAFGLVHITREFADRDKDKAAVFAKVSHLFFSTMSQAQANFEIAAVDVVVHPENRRKFEEARINLASRASGGASGQPNEHWGFHGTSRDSIRKICETNFLTPDGVAELIKQQTKSQPKKAAAKKAAKKKTKMAKPVEVLDEGYYGRGIYFTKFSDYALWYSDERDSDQVLLSRLLTGKEYICNKRMDGKGLVKGHDSHVSPKGNEFVIFTPDQILPRYIITFREKEAKVCAMFISLFFVCVFFFVCVVFLTP